MRNPIAVLISDLHFNLRTLEVASAALRIALRKAGDLGVPTIIAGDLNDSKAIIRAEVANALIQLLSKAETPTYIMVGNHDKINEKGDEHGLNYLQSYAQIVSQPCSINLGAHEVLLIPYQNDSSKIESILSTLNSSCKTLYPGNKRMAIMHQGFLGAAMGDYVQDKSSIPTSVVKDYTVISGHYHKHQTLDTVTYIGSPYTVTFGEAKDGPKGFLILYSDGTFTREYLNLRRHIKIECHLEDLTNLLTAPFHQWCNDDIIWLKITGPYSKLKLLKKKDLSMMMNIGHSDFKLDLVEIDDGLVAQEQAPVVTLTAIEILDNLIDATSDTDEQKQFLRSLYRDTLNREGN